ncbi:hypothetical protein CGZ95_05330 [Enemella evansiae]|nr:hypothetical protein CGZ95_05330 [Enemella evansiae]
MVQSSTIVPLDTDGIQYFRYRTRVTARRKPAASRPTKEQTREQVLTAAAEVFSTSGFTGATLDQIAAAGGLTKGAIYSSFGGKEDLFFEVLRARTRERLLAAREIRDTSAPFSGTEVGRLLERFTVDDPTWHLALIQFWATVTNAPDPARHAELRRMRGELRGDIEALLVEGGVPAERARWLAVAILALSNGLAIERAIDPEATEGVFGTALDAWTSDPAPPGSPE